MAVIQTLIKPKQVNAVSLCQKLLYTATELQAIRIRHSDNRTKVSMIGHGVLFTEETLTVPEVYFVTDSRLQSIKSSTEQNLPCLSFRKTRSRPLHFDAEKDFCQ